MILVLRTYRLVFCVFLLSFSTLGLAQVQLAFQGGEPADTWNYVSSGADATAQAQAFLTANVVSGTQSIVVGGNTGGGSCIDGGSGNGSAVARFFTFSSVDISSSSDFFRTLSFHWGSRHPICVGTGWDSGENLVFTAYYDGVAQPSTTLAMGNNNTNFNIQNFIHTHTIPPCVSSFYFHITITTNRRDELLFLDNVSLTAPQLNTGGNNGTQVNLTICQTELPYNWNGLIFNQAGTQSQVLTSSFGCDSLVNYNLFVNQPLAPTFNTFGPHCSGANIPNLPTVSLNGINGNWSPAINNTATSSYTFTPTIGQCASPTSKIIVINPNVNPTFTQVGPYCSGASIPNLPTTSNNNISGTWSPSLNNLATTTYTFTPNSGACAIPTTMTIEITPNMLPTFPPVESYCQGDNVPNLPNVSSNNISGTWSPAINNQVTTLYTFSPASNFCALSTTLAINIIPNVIPEFSNVGTYCVDANIPPLATTSLNSILGTWSPAINNQQTTTYTFTPSQQGQCAVSTTLTIPVANDFIPIFNFPLAYCQGSSIPALPSTSVNGINGTWSPALSNQLTNTYTFTALPNQCSQNTQLTIQILENIDPIFNTIPPVCAGTTAQVLPTNSLNNIAGTWSPAFNNNVSSNYTFIPTPLNNGGQCANQTNLFVQVLPILTPTFPPVSPICAGENLAPLPTTSTNGITGNWSPALNNLQTTNYTFTPNPQFCSNTANSSITVYPKDSVYVNISICQGQLPFSWQGNSFNSGGTYYYNNLSIFGCDSTTILTLNVVPNPVLQFDTLLCIHDLPYNFFGQEIFSPGVYEHTSNSISGCDTTYVITLGIHQPLNISFNQTPSSSCSSPQHLIYNINNSTSIVSSLWSMNGETGNNINEFSVILSDVGCYDLELLVTDINGCNTKIEQLNMACIHPNPIASFYLNSTSFEAGINVQPINQSIGANSFSWNFGDNSLSQIGNNLQHIYTVPGSYDITLNVTNEYGCSDEYAQMINITDPLLIYVPNTFTPGGNDQNEIFLPVITAGINRYNYRLLIFNRWGEVMFESLNPDFGWDGSYGGNYCPSGVYIWKIEFENHLGVKDMRQGHVNLLR